MNLIHFSGYPVYPFESIRTFPF